MRSATVTRRPRARIADARNTRVRVVVGDIVRTAWGAGRITLIGPDAALYVKISDPGKAENGKTVRVLTIR